MFHLIVHNYSVIIIFVLNIDLHLASTSGKAQSIDDSCTQISCEPYQLTPFNILKRHFSEKLDVVSDPNRLANDFLKVNENPETLITLCKLLTNQNNAVTSRICKTMMKELGKKLK